MGKEERWKEKDMVFHVKLSQKTTILSRKAGRIVKSGEKVEESLCVWRSVEITFG